MTQFLMIVAITCFADTSPQINIYSIPPSPKFGILVRNTSPSVFDNSKFKNEYTPQAGPLPLELPTLKIGDEIGFAITIPEQVGKDDEAVEIEPPPFVTLLGVTARSYGPVSTVFTRGGTKVIAGVEIRYSIKGAVPKNIFLLYLPKTADLNTLQGIYPEKASFTFEDDKAAAILADTALAQVDVVSYIDLLHRGGAIIVPGKDGKKVYVAVMPDGELLRHALQPVAKTADKSGPPKSAPAPTKKAPAKSEPAKPAGQPDERAARSALSAAKAFLGVNQTDKAKEYLEKAVQLAPDSDAGKEAKGLLQGLNK